MASSRRWSGVFAGFLVGGALLFAGCGEDDDDDETTGVEALPSATCGPVEYGGEDQPDALIASDLPMQGASAERSEQMVEAIRIVLEQREWLAGETRVAFQPCDDSIARTGEWDAATCRENAGAYASNPDVVGVVGTYNSGCAAEIIPILNRASEGGVAMVSPGNTLICLTQPSESCPRGDPDSYYPTGERNYARVVPNDAAQGAGLAEFARREGIRRPFVLYAADDPVSLGQGITFRLAADRLGLKVAGFEAWDPEANAYTDLMREVKTAGADAVLLGGLLEQNGPQLIEDKVSELGPNDGDVKLLASDGFAQQATIDEAGDASEGMFVSVPGRYPVTLPPAGQTVVENLEEDFPDQPVELYAPYAGAAAQLLLDAIGSGGGSRGAVIDALFDVQIEDGIVGDFRIEPSGDPSEGPITISRAAERFEPLEAIEPPPALVSAARG
jgi:branched-chain amino acid transport system substrate-binding protein